MPDNLGRIFRAALELVVGALALLWDWLTGKPKDERPEPHEHELQYFLPGQVVYYVKHNERLTEADINKILKHSEAEWFSAREQRITISLRRSFPFTGFTLLFVDVQNAKDLVGLIPFLNEMFSKSSSFPGLTLEISPNWVLGSAGHGAPHPPSPGSWPLSVPDPQRDSWKYSLIEDDPKKTRAQNTLPLPFFNEPASKIHVAILDTAPDELDLVEAYERWHDSHPLLDRLLGNNGKLQVHRGIITEIELMDFSPVGHRYLMGDHGLFVAGIVNTIAPDATLHLIRVFTPYGSASLETIAQGLDRILQALRHPNDPVLNPHGIKRPLIVNCSFGLSLDAGPDFPVSLRGLNTSLRDMFAELTSQDGVVVVAAAGNDSQRNNRQSTRFPAAFGNVISVGALPNRFPPTNSQFQAASYSNRAHYMTVGGEPGRGEGVLGVYTSELPVYAEGCLSFLWRKLTGRSLGPWAGEGHLPPIPPPLTLDRIRYKLNKNGWAEWAGTSFATSKITGVLAAQWAEPAFRGTALNFASAQAELDNHLQRLPTSDGETVIYVEQRTSPP